MKQYKNICISFIFYVVAVLVFFSPIPFINNSIAVGLGVTLILAGILFGLRSIIKKESRWVGYLMMLVGVLMFASPSILYVLGANGLL